MFIGSFHYSFREIFVTGYYLIINIKELEYGLSEYFNYRQSRSGVFSGIKHWDILEFNLENVPAAHICLI